jgi:hypothetical protein
MVPAQIAPPRGRRAAARARTAVARRLLRSQKKGWGPEEKRTAVLGVVATGTVVMFVVVEVGRVWRRGSAPLPGEAEDLLSAAEEAVAETVEAARAGYQDVSVRENATFMLLISFVATFASARGISYMLRRRRTVGPFRDLVVGRRHIHHFVPGIAILMVSGAAAILTRDETIEPKLALAFGAGMGMTLDESALLLELEDVYWSPEGLLGVQITLSVMALGAALALALRFTRRGEELVLQADRPANAPAVAPGQLSLADAGPPADADPPAGAEPPADAGPPPQPDSGP